MSIEGLEGLQNPGSEEAAFDVELDAADEGAAEILGGLSGPEAGVDLGNRLGEHFLGDLERGWLDPHLFEEAGETDGPEGEVGDGEPNALLRSKLIEDGAEEAEEFFVRFVGGQQLFTKFGDEV